ncbi:MAG TPA: flagellar motor protein [Polyangiaceae bacterium]|jgi:chemotaxis protein MotA|nr:flagellar motor protein [Polyangiaceae bacterium]
MEKGTVFGLAVGLGCILGGNAIEGGHIGSLLQPTAFIIVMGGTIGATMVGFPLEVFIKGCKALKEVFGGAHHGSNVTLIDEITQYAFTARKDGILALEQVLPKVNEAFLKQALGMAVDGMDSKDMRENLELILTRLESDGEKPAKVWEAAGGYAPTIGIIGAVMGLIHVMQNLSDVSKVGSGIAVAFVATIYGVALANLLFLPAAAKLKGFHKDETARLEIMMEGALAIQQGQNPNLIRDKLLGIGAPEAKEGAAAAAALSKAAA